MAHILLVTHWTDGDVLPFIEIGKQMLQNNHKVILFTHCFYRKKVIASGLHFEALDTETTYKNLVEDMKQEIDPFRDWEGFVRFQNKYESVAARLSEFEKIKRHIEPGQTIIIAKNRSSVSAFLAAEKYRIPLINLFMNPVEIPNMLIFNNYFGAKILPELNQLRNAIGLPSIGNWLAFHSMSKINIALWPKWYAPIESNWPRPVHYAGFMVSSDNIKTVIPDKICALLNSKRIKILITAGTSKMLHPEFFLRSISACAKLEYPSVLVTRYPDLIPEHLPSEIIWVQEAPLRQIMPQFDIVIHHGGIGTVTNALEAAVPQLVLPFYVDRPFNASCIQALGTGFSVPLKDWNTEVLSNYMLDLQKPHIKVKCAEYSGKIKAGLALSEITNLIEESLKCNLYPDINYGSVPDNAQILAMNQESIVAKHSKNENIKMMLLRKKLAEDANKE